MKAVCPRDVPHCRNIFLEISTVDPCKHFEWKSWATMALSGTKTATMKLTKKAAVKLFDYTLITHLLSTVAYAENFQGETKFRHNRVTSQSCDVIHQL